MGENTGGILLAIVGFIVVVLVVITFLSEGEAFENAVCKFTVYFSDQTSGVGKTLGFNPILCKTHYQEMETMEDLAESAAATWKVFGQGELDPSGTNWLLWQQTKCFELYRGEVTGDLVGVNKDQFKKYLQEKGDIDGKTYWNFINKGDIDYNGIILAFDKLEQNDFIGVFYFEEIEPAFWSPSAWGYNLMELIAGDINDWVVITKDNNDARLKCTEIY